MVRVITIDQNGRLVVPQDVRRRLRLRAGSRLRIDADDERITLEPIDEGGGVVERDGLLVATGRLGEAWPDARELNDARVAKLAGLPAPSSRSTRR